MKRMVKTVLAVAFLAAVAAAFFGVRECALAAKIQFVPAVLAFNAVALTMLVVLIALRARLYCELICPLGVAQELVRILLRRKTRRVCSRLPDTKVQLWVKWCVFALFAVAGVCGLSFMWLDPYGIFGRGVTLTGVLFFFVLVLAAVGSGRIWCNWICPVGTVLQAVAKISVFKDKVAKCDHCEECRKCFK
jgi:polyferredoxin